MRVESQHTTLTWVDLPVGGNTISVHDALEDGRELVGAVVGGRGLLG